MKINEIQKERIAVYKWIKIIQAVLLLVLGAAFILIGILRINDDGKTSIETVSYCAGTAFVTYGVVSAISGYLLERSPLSKEVMMGLIIASLGTTILIKPEILSEVFPFFLIVFFYGLSALIITYGVEKVIGKEFTRNITNGVLLFVLSAAIIGLTTTYCFFYENESLLNYILVALGLLLVVFGSFSIGLLLVRVHNTNKQIKEQEINEEQKQKVETELKNTNTKIIDISELKKKNDKKVYRKPTTTTQIKLIRDDLDTDVDSTDDDKKQEKPSYPDPVVEDKSKNLKKK